MTKIEALKLNTLTMVSFVYYNYKCSSIKQGLDVNGKSNSLVLRFF